MSEGPGSYDPNDDVGFKADPKSGFLGGDRFWGAKEEGRLDVPILGDSPVLVRGPPVACSFASGCVRKSRRLRKAAQGCANATPDGCLGSQRGAVFVSGGRRGPVQRGLRSCCKHQCSRRRLQL